MLVNRASHESDPDLFIKAFDKLKEIEANVSVNYRKGKMQDPMFSANDMFGFKQKDTIVSWNLMTQMGQQVVVSAVHKKIIESIAKFSRFQKDQFSTGYYFEKTDGTPISKSELENEIPNLKTFIQNTGTNKNNSRLDFEGFMRVATKNSLTYDHAPWENVFNRKGELDSFYNLDPTTIYIADSYFDERINEDTMQRESVGGYYPSYVQRINNVEIAEFYDWELALMIRNPSSSILNNGYGRSELEDLINIITYLSNGIKYNGTQFDEGFMGSGFLFFKEGSNNKLEEMKRMIRSYRNTQNAGSVAVIGGQEKPEYVKIRESNKDQEYSNFIAFLTSIVCSFYNITPEILGLRGMINASINYESSGDDKIKHGLSECIEPILNCIAANLNMKVLSRLYDGKYKICFGGTTAETQESQIQRMKEKQGLVPLNEILKEMGLPEDKKLGKYILNPQYIQLMQILQGQEGSEDQLEQEQPEPEPKIKKSLTNEDFENYWTNLINNTQ